MSLQKMENILIDNKFSETKDSTVKEKCFIRGKCEIRIKDETDLSIFFEGGGNINASVNDIIALLAYLDLSGSQKKSIKGKVYSLDEYHSVLREKEDLTAGQKKFMENYRRFSEVYYKSLIDKK